MTKKEATAVAKILNTLPRKVRVGPYMYTLDVTDKPLMIDNDPVEKMGICWAQRGEIALGAKFMLTPETAVGLVIHELLHGIWSNQNLGKKANEEDTVLGFEIGLLSLFKDNPELIDWIRKSLK